MKTYLKKKKKDLGLPQKVEYLSYVLCILDEHLTYDYFLYPTSPPHY